nr:MAG TPA: hypothetical protein [Caudoviricetes sp.]
MYFWLFCILTKPHTYSILYLKIRKGEQTNESIKE